MIKQKYSNKTRKKLIHKHKSTIKIIKNNTPLKDKLISNIIKKSLKQKNNIPQSLSNIQTIHSIKKSFSPKINKDLVSLTKAKPYNILICDNNLLKINIGTINKPICLDYNNIKVKNFLLRNLKSEQQINCNDIIPPKQYLSNCWFNTMFITFFISDKGRKFFKFFRQLMIEGKQANGNVIPTELAKAFFIFNIAIEASYNNLLKNIAYLLNTNLLIKKIYTAINTTNTIKKSDIINVGQAGNPIDYYKGIINYLNNNSLNIKTINVMNSASSNNINMQLSNLTLQNMPDIIILEIFDKGKHGAGISGKIKDKEQKLTINNIDYILDAIIIRDTKGLHFCSLLTCNKKEYSFDGASFNRMSLFKWKNIINKKKLWKFEGHDLTWNFMNGYQILFYYRI